jgi:hypothetical protein
VTTIAPTTSIGGSGGQLPSTGSGGSNRLALSALLFLIAGLLAFVVARDGASSDD